jgi:hypothetical protein
MRDRRAGDIGDFFKLGLLRWLVAPSPYVRPLRLGVIRFGAIDDSDDHDDTHMAYLDPSSTVGHDLRPLDANLYDRLGRLSTTGDRSIRSSVSSGVLPADTVIYDRELTFADLAPDDRAARVVRRERWFHDAMVAVDQCSLVFVEPDNGFCHDARSTPSYRDHAEKDAYLSEVGQLLVRGQSVVVSHRADPTESLAFQAMDDVHEALGVDPLAVVRAARGTARMFVVIPAELHRSDLEARLGALQLSSWCDELRLSRWRRATVAV